MKNKISIKNLNFAYIKNNFVLKNFNFEFHTNKIYFLFGLNASGKSTLCNLISSLIPLTFGEINYFEEVKIFNKKTSKKYFSEVNKRIGTVFQNCEKQLFCENILDDVLYTLKQNNYKETEAIQIAKKWLEYFKIPSDLYEKSFFDLSNGQQRKVALASIFSINKKCYILDEPTIGLDYETKIILSNLLKQLRNEEKIIIIISHDFDWSYTLADECLMLKNHELVLTDNPYNFFSNNLVKETFNYQPFLLKIQNDLAKNKHFKNLISFNIKDISSLISLIKEGKNY